MSLETLLRDAAPEATFHPEDVHRRVRRTQTRRRRVLGGGAVVILLISGLGAWALLQRDEPSEVVAGPPGDTETLPITEEALLGSRWVQVAPATTAPAWVDFDEAGQATVGGACGSSSGAWVVSEGRLRLVATPEESSIYCDGEPPPLSGSPTLDVDGRLVLDGVTLRRLDTLGQPATREDLLGAWLTPDGELEVSFDDQIRVGPCSFAFIFERGRMRSYNPACDFVGPSATISQTVLRGRATIDGEDLWFTTPYGTVHLVRADAGTATVDFAAGPWVPEDPGGLVDLPRLVFTADGSFRALGPCSTWSGRWELVGGRPQVDVTSSTIGYCVDEEGGDRLVAPVAAGGVIDLEGEMLVVGGNRFRQLGPDLAVTEPDFLLGLWTTDDGRSVEFAEDTLSIDDNCATVGWELRASELRYRPVMTCLIGINPRSSERLGLESSVLVRLDGDRLYLLREGDQIAVFHQEPSVEGAERVLYRAISYELLLDPRWEDAGDGDLDLVGFVWNGEVVEVEAAPLTVGLTEADGHLAFCGDYSVRVTGPRSAADALFGVLACEVD